MTTQQFNDAKVLQEKLASIATALSHVSDDSFGHLAIVDSKGAILVSGHALKEALGANYDTLASTTATNVVVALQTEQSALQLEFDGLVGTGGAA